MIKRKIVMFLLLAGVLAAGYTAYSKGFFPLRSEPAGGELTLLGNVDIRQVDLAFRVGGRLAQVNYEEGDTLKPGDLVAQLDPEPYEEAVALSQAALAQAQAELAKQRRGYRPQEVQVARAQLDEALASLKTLERQYERDKELVGKGAISKQAFDDIQAERDQARARVQSAQESLNLMHEGYREEDIQAAQAACDQAAAQLAQAQTQLADTQLYAPARGTVLTRTCEPGAIVSAGTSVLTLSKAQPVWVRAYIPEPQLGAIRPGMPVRVYSDSLPGPAATGHIGFISPQAEFTPKNVETPELRTQLVYRFRVVVEGAGDRLRQGMPVTVKIDTQATTSSQTQTEPSAR